jgi:Domain of unknown function (DUF4265)
VVIEYEEHPSRASTLRAGEFVVLGDAVDEDCTVWFAAEKMSGGNVRWEGLLARRLATDRARICAVPFWLYDVNLGDEVSIIESVEGAPVATGVVHDAGNVGFRVFHPAAADLHDDRRWYRLLEDLERFECWFDPRTPRHVALSAPPQHAQAVADYLQQRGDRGDFEWETIRRTHPGAT